MSEAKARPAVHEPITRTGLTGQLRGDALDQVGTRSIMQVNRDHLGPDAIVEIHHHAEITANRRTPTYGSPTRCHRAGKLLAWIAHGRERSVLGGPVASIKR
jgi:hypothetical protein